MKKKSLLCLTLLLTGCVSTESHQTPDAADTNGIPPEPESIVQPVSPPEVATPVEDGRGEQVAVLQPVSKPKPSAVKLKPQPAYLKKTVLKTKDGKLILGRQEWVWLSPEKKFVRAYVELDQKESTLGVTALTPFERDGRAWVKFKSRGKAFELPVVRWQGSEENKLAVVQFRTRLGELNDMTDFVLVDGKEIRLGTDFTRDVAIVDLTREYVQPKQKLTQ
ncbi:RimK/LysX family protein [Photobacterium sp. 1_MG-2023]|uniref:putative ATP-dependent zinc protease n=1 Tax=Photobacterium sp. 1_MG-2023 TaxID=3062646 RepID=UPI0026E20807|nr:RimK/LysX family protein [Photobacterium sp. 1_MG-2023]MDO6706710.1 RimK/LysX family protein [Photobacterium sp. 1_MG-2023]